VSRRAVLVHAIGVTGLVTALAAAASTLARGTFRAPVARAGSPGSGGGAGPGTDIGPASALAPGQAQTYLDSATQRPAVAVRAEDGSLFGLSAVCTHAGCELRFSAGALACPCHGSTFDLVSGASQGGPARKPLDTGPVIERDGRLIAMPLQPGERS
jgi:nitrite reductase/ring-hydroxylating ferredoxin subunit